MQALRASLGALGIANSRDPDSDFFKTTGLPPAWGSSARAGPCRGPTPPVRAIYLGDSNDEATN